MVPGGIQVTKALEFVVGEAVEWTTPCPNNQLKAHKGIVIEVVAAGATPTKAGDWSFSPRGHESYVVKDHYYTTAFWPRVKWLRKVPQ